ncbi:PREDICTED: transient receptor potential cation channel subfamily V member 5-like [Branchiostoma belcheri]|uniref:Transient receptor potential cation channel subfamily V member 5-like n=1 Tax=Branchiostoma belcheri TaxID=7741 RepID=A0A6P5AW90_BRABE|nr:PREDICTED: transient receptor potential cation channel subfamily V member 5-like [Branchiostoma belcheri]
MTTTWTAPGPCLPVRGRTASRSPSPSSSWSTWRNTSWGSTRAASTTSWRSSTAQLASVGGVVRRLQIQSPPRTGLRSVSRRTSTQWIPDSSSPTSTVKQVESRDIRTTFGMGNTLQHGGIHDAVKEQANQQGDGPDKAKRYPLYDLVDLKGGGELVKLTRESLFSAEKSRKLNQTIREKVGPFLYNEGAGKKVPIKQLIMARNRDRMRTRPQEDKKKKTGGFGLGHKSNSVSALMDPVHNEQDGQWRDVCWDLEKRGSVGETILHLCFLNGTQVHNELAKRLVDAFPKLVNDIYVSEEYYGEAPLHMAIVSEDQDMVKYFVDHGASVTERCCGNFFCPEDQKGTREDSLEHEWVKVSMETNYEGYTYWGEYPLSFAACLEQKEMFNLLRKAGANPNLADNNGNTVLHHMVIQNKPKMYNLALESGASPCVKNRQGLTPLTLASKLGRKKMFQHILETEREVYWTYGEVTCAAYNLTDLDTITPTGEINKKSALSLIIQGDQAKHVDMIDGLIYNLLRAKWKTYARKRFYWRFVAFFIYLIFLTTAFFLRPHVSLGTTTQTVNQTDENGTIIIINGTTTLVNQTVYDPCYLQALVTPQDKVRLAMEILTLLGAVLVLLSSAMEIYHQGIKTFLLGLLTAPAKTLYVISCVFVMMMIPGRAACAPQYEDVVCILTICTTTPYFLFFFRGFKLVGPFVVMIYKMLKGDILRFLIIYAVFVMAFSQVMFVIFRAARSTLTYNQFADPLESIMGMIVMSFGEFADMYETFDHIRHPFLAKAVFMLYMGLVTILLINMLIAMMGNTYQSIQETRKEWLRQWAQIVLIMEQSLSSDQLRKEQLKYSQPLSSQNKVDDTGITKTEQQRGFVERFHNVEDEEELRIKREKLQKHMDVLFSKRDGRWLPRDKAGPVNKNV